MRDFAVQFLHFGIVGIIATIVDIGLYTLCANVLGIPYLIAGVAGFLVSMVVNYYLSMKFVFKHRDDISRRREFGVFAILSLIGLILNEMILLVCIDGIYPNSAFLQVHLTDKHINVVAKLFATGVVTLYNFFSRKKFLEKK